MHVLFAALGLLALAVGFVWAPALNASIPLILFAIYLRFSSIEENLRRTTDNVFALAESILEKNGEIQE